MFSPIDPFIHQGLAFSLLIGPEWAYVWPRKPQHPPSTDGASGGASGGALPVPDAAALAGVWVLDSPEAVGALRAAELEEVVRAVTPDQSDIDLIHLACAGF